MTQMKQHNEADIWLNELPYRVKHHMQSSDRLFGTFTNFILPGSFAEVFHSVESKSEPGWIYPDRPQIATVRRLAQE